MKKRFSYVLLLLIGLTIIPGSVCAASSDSIGVSWHNSTVENPNGLFTTNCSGVRITFIDQNGQALSGSYDFTTRSCGVRVAYNSGTGDKSKKSNDSFNWETISGTSNIPKLGTLYKNMLSLKDTRYPNMNIDGMTLNTNDFTGGGYTGGYDNELNWFKSITKRGLKPEVFKDNVNAFIDAIEMSYSGFDGESLKLQMSNSCNSDTEVFIQMEPLETSFTQLYNANLSSGSQERISCENLAEENGFHLSEIQSSEAIESYLKQNCWYTARVFGTVRDADQYFKDEDSRRTNNQYSTMKIHFYKYGRLIHYNESIIAPNFTAYTPVPVSDNISSSTALDVNSGAGVAIDWATDSALACGSCSFDSSTQSMSYDDAIIVGNYPSLDGEDTRKAIDPSYAGGYNCCYALTNNYNSLNQQWKDAYNKYCNQTTPPSSSCRIDGDTYYCKNGEVCDVEQYDEECGNPDCCTDEPIEAGKLEGIVVNCCVENTHSYVKEYDLDELFCRHNTLHVDKYFEKCNTDEYINKDVELNDYCDMYCTERVTIDVPEAITAKSGRYFTLEKNSKGNTTSPYIEGYKRCRVRIKYNQWEEDYIRAIREEVKAYNEYQKQMAYVESYNNLKANSNSAEFVATVKCSATATAPNCKKGVSSECFSSCKNNGGSDQSCTSSCPRDYGGGTGSYSLPDQSCKITYNKHNVSNTKLESYYASNIINDNGSQDNPIVNNHLSILLNRAYNGKATWGASVPSDYVATDPVMTDCDAIVTNSQKQVFIHRTNDGCTGSANYVCYIEWSELSSHVRNIDELQKPYRDAASAAENNLKQLVSNAKNLEEKLSTCNNYFNSEEGKPETMYDFDPSMTFRYSQIYRDDNGQSQLSVIDIPFMDEPGCTITGPETGEIDYDNNGKDTYPDRYSEIYGNGFMSSKIFSGDNLKLDRNTSDFNSMIYSSPYYANKRFTHDARYKAVCEWKEDENQVNTLVPNGAVTDNAEANFTVHEREYKVYLTTYDGTFETDWSITNVGEKGKFDKFIQEQGTKTCADNEVTNDNTFSCQLHVEYEIVYTGKCNGVTNNPDDCEPVNDINGLFTFKVVDETNIFPTGTTTADGSEVAKNWTATEKGRAAKEEIEENGKKGVTYDEERATYKFHLTPAAMRHIKNYNVTRNSNQRGGYSDFEMKCECPNEPQTNSAVEGVGCTKCKSILLEDLANGVINYDGQSHNVNVWNANRSIDLVRSAMWR